MTSTTLTPAAALRIVRRRRAAEKLVRLARGLDTDGILPAGTVFFRGRETTEAWNIVADYEPFSRNRYVAQAYARAIEAGLGIKWGRARALAALKAARSL